MKIVSELALLGGIALIFSAIPRVSATKDKTDEEAGRKYINKLNKIMEEAYHKNALAVWAYNSNTTDYNRQQLDKSNAEITKITNKYWKKTNTFPWTNYRDPVLKRMFQLYSKITGIPLSDEDSNKVDTAVANMVANYNGATICDYKDKTKCGLHIDPDISNIFATSDDPEELKYAWVEWHNAAGAPSRGNFTIYVDLDAKSAELNNLTSAADWWLNAYETPDIEDQFIAMWAQVKPLYQQLHAYIRSKLRQKYGEDIVSARGPIPGHLLGNVWGQSWTNLASFSVPYPEKTAVDLTAALVAKNFTPLKLVKAADDFFISMNMTAMPKSFYKYSIIEKPTDGRILSDCHGGSYSEFDGDDVRIIQCTQINSDYYYITFAQLGRTQYDVQCSAQPVIFRGPANPAFDDVVGDIAHLSASTLKHFKVLGLVEDGEDDAESNLNQLFITALDKIAFLPFSYLLDMYRYGVYRGTTTSEDYNCHYWQFRESIQGIQPPVTRTEDDFDPAAKYHVSADAEYIKFYLSYVIQYQFQKALCQLAGEYVPGDDTKLLSNCDIYNSSAAGNAFAKMLSLGSSKPWPEVMEVLTGQQNIDASSVLEYFQPLYDWLVAENEKNGEYIGWESSTVEYCTAEQRLCMEASGFNERMKKYAAICDGDNK